MVLVKIDQVWVNRSKAIAKMDWTKSNKNFVGEEGSVRGFVGEHIFQDCFPYAIHKDTWTYDFILDGKRVDVKTRKGNFPPKSSFDTVIQLNKPIHDVDYFFICQVTEDLTKGWLLGYISAEDLKTKPVVQKGEPRQQGGVYKASGLLVYDHELTGVENWNNEISTGKWTDLNAN